MRNSLKILSIAFLTAGLSACNPKPADSAAPVAAAQPSTAQSETEARESKHIEIFDDLDFNVYSGQKWDEFHRSHAQNILVHYPDGHTTTGLDAHLAELKPQFEFAPDTNIKVHPVKVAQDDFTAVTGIMEGTFSRPMKLADGTVIQPTNKPFKLEMATFGRWENGVMVEEWLFWDNQAFMKQIGLAE